MRGSTTVKAIWFPDWEEVLARQPMPELQRPTYRRAILEYLGFCKQTRQRATVASARQFMHRVETERRLILKELATWKAALNWFFKQGANPPPALAPTSGTPQPTLTGPAKGHEPPLAACDLGGPEWEQKLIRELRTRHYQWSTEQTYRLWAGRFAHWLKARGAGGGVETAQEVELRDFLSDLATRQRASVATQRQALNALVFLVREALKRPLEDWLGAGIKAMVGLSYWSGGGAPTQPPPTGSGAVFGFSGLIAEVLFYSRALSAGERGAVDGYLNGRYGL